MPRTPRIIICAECGKERPHSAKGLCGTCYQRQRRAANPERVREQHRQYRAANPERVREQARRWYAANPERIRERGRQWRAANPEFQRQWRAANHEWVRERDRQYRAANAERIRERYRQWRAANHEWRRERNQRRKSRKRALPATLTLTEWRAILAAFGHKCAYCGASRKKLTQDHVHPLSKGGAYTVQNIVPACGRCNSAKGNRPPPKPVQTLLL